ncbi:MAG: hypothetical protein L6R38_000139 [Xanthoria sp. 2 TBL-2021]|nr:MAG: hypothetical protein L6R38_000139 [Xanthoria sp. 2 TBL-2021]
MAAKLLRVTPPIQQGPVRAAVTKILGLSTTRGSREPASFPRPLTFESYYSFFYARSRPSPNLQFTASIKAFQSVRGFASTTTYRQLEKPPAPAAEVSKDSRRDANSNIAQNSTIERKETILPTDAQAAQIAISSISKEISWIDATLRDPDIKLTPQAQAKNKARLSKLEQAYRNWGAKAAWWDTIYREEPQQIKRASDVYKRVKIVKGALERDAESNEPVWTARERTAMEANYGRWEAETLKQDKWYKKIAWGPSIIGTAILNIIF